MTNIFSHIDDDIRGNLSRSLESVEFNDGQIIVKQGDVANAFFIVEDGIK
jgi:CRP-like cAMP-binding protein